MINIYIHYQLTMYSIFLFQYSIHLLYVFFASIRKKSFLSVCQNAIIQRFEVSPRLV